MPISPVNSRRSAQQLLLCLKRTKRTSLHLLSSPKIFPFWESETCCRLRGWRHRPECRPEVGTRVDLLQVPKGEEALSTVVPTKQKEGRLKAILRNPKDTVFIIRSAFRCRFDRYMAMKGTCNDFAVCWLTQGFSYPEVGNARAVKCFDAGWETLTCIGSWQVLRASRQDVLWMQNLFLDIAPYAGFRQFRRARMPLGTS